MPMPADAGPDHPKIAIGRLKKRPDFLRVAQGRRAARPGLVLQARPTPETEPAEPNPARVGFTATRKIGKAVQRNRARRRLRAAAAAVLPCRGRAGHDYVLVARAGTLTRRFADLIADLETAVQEVHAPRTGGSRRPPERPAPASIPEGD